MSADDLAAQMRAMVEQDVHRAYLHCRSGLRPRYLSDAWWDMLVGCATAAERIGFRLGAVDEFNWPSGEARDWRLPGLPSRVLARRPDLRMRRLRLVRDDVTSSGPVRLSAAADELCIVGAEDVGALVPESLRLVESGSSEVRIDGPARVYRYSTVEAVGFDGGLVDALNPDCAEVFIEEVYEQYRRRLGALFGETFFGFFCDHEGDYGKRIAWTPDLFAAFEGRWGYDLRPLLPLLHEESGAQSAKVRCDYLALVGQLYASRFFGRLSAWCEEHGVSFTGHTWEESLQAAAAYVGDHIAVQRALSTPGVDSLGDRGRDPRHFQEAASVAHFRRTGFVVENQGIQGIDSGVDPERLRPITNAIAVWGATDLVPHAFAANAERVEFPEDWFLTQPWWPQFGEYARLAARLCTVNASSRRLARTLLYHPRESSWVHSAPVFDEAAWGYGFTGYHPVRGPEIVWQNPLDRTDRAYDEAMAAFAGAQRELLVVDADQLREATVQPGGLAIGDSSFQAVLLPAADAIARDAARKLLDFVRESGLVVAIGEWPRHSPEHGYDDPELIALFEDLEKAETAHLVESPDAALDLVARRDPAELRVLDGDATALLASTRVLVDGTLLHVAVNTSDDGQRWLLAGPPGDAEVWNPEDGTRCRAPTRNGGAETQFELELGAHESRVIVRPAGGASAIREHLRPRLSRDDPMELTGPWTVGFEPSRVEVPWARSRTCAPGAGEAAGWAEPHCDDSAWELTAVDPRLGAIRSWWVCGPFPYGTHTGYDQPHPPELDPRADARYAIDGGQLRWQELHASDRFVDLGEALRVENPPWDGERWVTAYALAIFHSAADLEGELRVVPESNVKAWVNGSIAIAERDDHHGYMDQHDGFALSAPAALRAGPNTVLLKVSQGFRWGGGRFGFVARLCDAEGRPLPLELESPALLDTAERAERWYRLELPPGARTFVLPDGCAAWLDGHRLSVSGNGGIRLPPGDGPQVLAICCAPAAALDDGLAFDTEPAIWRLGSLTKTGAAFHAGTATYECEFDAPATPSGPTELDLGVVGSTASVWVNGSLVGSRSWSPFTFDVTGHLEPGRNHLRVVVANSAAQARAGNPAVIQLGRPVGGPDLLANLDRNGLMGPVTLCRLSDAGLG